MTFETTEQLTIEARNSFAAGSEPVFLELDDEAAPKTSSGSRAADEAPPGWFSRMRAKSADRSRRRAARHALPAIAVRPEDQAGCAWQEPTLLEKLTYLFRGRPAVENGETVENPKYGRFKKLLAFAVTGYGVSLLLHTLLTGALALYVVDVVRSESLSLLLSNSTDEVVELDNIDTSLEAAGGADKQLELPHLQVADLKSDELVQPTPPSEAQPTVPAVGAGDGQKEGDGSGLGFAMPSADQVVTKGSFSVWTVPEDPAPGESYNIVIQVKLPKDTKRYNSRDLYYKVIGTDGYKQPPDGVRSPARWLRVKNDVTQLVVWVPAAARLVKDKIEVRSKILDEHQELEIEF